MDLTAYGENAAAALTDASREINRLERLLSRTIDTSEISQTQRRRRRHRLRGNGRRCWLSAQTYTAATDGAFDITIAPLVSLWGITTDSPHVPTQEEIDALLPLVGSEHRAPVRTTPRHAGRRAAPSTWAASPRATPPTGWLHIFARHGVTSGTASASAATSTSAAPSPTGSRGAVAIQDPAHPTATPSPWP